MYILENTWEGVRYAREGLPLRPTNVFFQFLNINFPSINGLQASSDIGNWHTALGFHMVQHTSTGSFALGFIKRAFFLINIFKKGLKTSPEYMYILTTVAVLFNSLDLPTTSIFLTTLVKISASWPFQKVLLKQDYEERWPRPLHALVRSSLKIIILSSLFSTCLLISWEPVDAVFNHFQKRFG